MSVKKLEQNQDSISNSHHKENTSVIKLHTEKMYCSRRHLRIMKVVFRQNKGVSELRNKAGDIGRPTPSHHSASWCQTPTLVVNAVGAFKWFYGFVQLDT